MKRRSKLERFAPAAVGLCLALPTLVVVRPPMIDLPLHEAVAGLLANWSDVTFAPRNVYALNLGHPNQLFYALIAVLSKLFGLTWASKLVVAGAVAAIPVAAATFATHLRRHAWPTLLVAPLGLGWLYYWGLLANMLGISLVLVSLVSVDRHVRRPSLRSLGVVLGWAALLYLAHEAALLSVMLVLAASGILAPRWTLARVALRLAPLPIVGAGLVAHTVLSRKLVRFLPSDLPSPHILSKLKDIPGVILSGFELWVQYLLFGAMLALLVAFARLAWKRPRVGSASLPRLTWLRRRLFALRYELACAGFLALYFILPMASGGATLVYHRFLPLAWALLVVVCAPLQRTELPRVLKLAAIAAPLCILIINIPQFFQADRMFSGFEEVTRSIEVGNATTFTTVSPPEPTNFSVNTIAGAIVARRGGRTGFDFTQSALAPVYQRGECDWPLTRQRHGLGTYDFRPAYDMRRFRYVVIYAREVDARQVLEQALAAEARLVVSQDRWYLFESKLKVRPLCGFDWKMPDPPPERLLERLGRLAAEPPAAIPTRSNP